MIFRNLALWVCMIILVGVSCSKPSQQVTEIKEFPIENTEGVITQSGVQFDKEISSDVNGSLRITAIEPTVIRLFELGDIDVKDARLVYQAKVRTEGVEGQVYLEMWCHFPANE